MSSSNMFPACLATCRAQGILIRSRGSWLAATRWGVAGSAKLPHSGAAVARRLHQCSPPVGAAVTESSPTGSWVVRSGIAPSTAQNKTSSAVP
jgi:hypothetical protein